MSPCFCEWLHVITLARWLPFPRLSILAWDALAYRGDCTLLAVNCLACSHPTWLFHFQRLPLEALSSLAWMEKMGISLICLHHFIMIHGLHLKWPGLEGYVARPLETKYISDLDPKKKQISARHHFWRRIARGIGSGGSMAGLARPRRPPPSAPPSHWLFLPVESPGMPASFLYPGLFSSPRFFRDAKMWGCNTAAVFSPNKALQNTSDCHLSKDSIW